MIEWTYFSLFLIGLLAGAPHCTVMCGGIVGMLSMTTRIDSHQIGHRSSYSRHFNILLAYNIGRIATYVLIGAIAGWLGSLFVGRDGIVFISPYLRVIPAIIMIALGLYIAGIWFGIARLEKIGQWIWQYVEPYSRRFIPVKSPFQASLLGLIWGWLPCGLIYSTAISYALPSGGIISGGLVMLAFGLGTLPVLLAVGVTSSKIMAWVSHRWMKKIVGLLVVGYGLWDLLTTLKILSM